MPVAAKLCELQKCNYQLFLSFGQLFLDFLITELDSFLKIGTPGVPKNTYNLSFFMAQARGSASTFFPFDKAIAQ